MLTPLTVKRNYPKFPVMCRALFPARRNAWELGVGPNVSLRFRPENGWKVNCVDGRLDYVQKVRRHYKQFEGGKHFKNIKAHNFALVDDPQLTEVKFMKAGAGSYVEGVHTPAEINRPIEGERESVTSPACTFDKLDPGNIDVLMIDLHGCEYFALKHMKSRPVMIMIEMRANKFKNAHTKQIKKWFKKNGYARFIRGHIDDYYIRQI